MKTILLALLIVCELLPAYGQNKQINTNKNNAAGKINKPRVTDTATIYHDFFKGDLPGKGNKVAVVLQLDHKLYSDYGAFTLTERYHDQLKPKMTRGEWTVLRGDARHENTTVVELDGPDKAHYFLRRTDGNLQKLDSALRELKPAANYVLKRDTPANKAIAAGNNTATAAGTYKGRLPCADCNRIETTLVLQCKDSCKAGSYIVTDKYVGTPKGDKLFTRKGKWHFDKQGTATNISRAIIVLNAEKPNSQSYYMVKKDGNLLPLDQNKQPIAMPVDATLSKTH